jgi:hypothetical protein
MPSASSDCYGQWPEMSATIGCGWSFQRPSGLATVANFTDRSVPHCIRSWCGTPARETRFVTNLRKLLKKDQNFLRYQNSRCREGTFSHLYGMSKIRDSSAQTRTIGHDVSLEAVARYRFSTLVRPISPASFTRCGPLDHARQYTAIMTAQYRPRDQAADARPEASAACASRTAFSGHHF